MRNIKRFIMVVAYLTLALVWSGAGSMSAQGETTQSDDTIVAEVFRTVNVRSGPSTTFDVVSRLSEGTVVTVVGRSDSDSNWLLVELDDSQGWVAYFTVSITGNPNTLPIIGGSESASVPETTVAEDAAEAATTAPEAEITPPSVPAENAPDRPLAGDTAEAEDEEVADSAEAVPANDFLTGVTLFNLNLRQSPSGDSDLILTVGFDETVIVLGRSEESDWLRVEYDGERGWLLSSLVDLDGFVLEDLPVVTTGLSLGNSIGRR